MSDQNKTCVLCGKSCAGQPRIKNQKGEYAHQACADASKKASVSAGAAVPLGDDDDLMGALLDDLPTAAPEPAGGGGLRAGCPGCGAALTPETVVCVSCGFNTKTGRAARTRVADPAQAAGGVAAMTIGAGSAAASGTAMLLCSLLGACIGGAVGAAVWAGIIIATNYEVGYVAIGVGALCGFGAALGARGETGLTTGLIACVVTLASISGGKYFASVHFANQFVSSMGSGGSIFTDMSDDEIADWFSVSDADAILQDRLDAGGLDSATTREYETLIEEGLFPDDYPSDVVDEARARWAALSPEDRDARMVEADASFDMSQEAMRAYIADAGFVNSFTLHDLFFFGFAVMAAYGVGSGGSTD